MHPQLKLGRQQAHSGTGTEGQCCHLFTPGPGYDNFAVFCQEAELFDPVQDPIALPAGNISDDEVDEVEPLEQSDSEHTTTPPSTTEDNATPSLKQRQQERLSSTWTVQNPHLQREKENQRQFET